MRGRPVLAIAVLCLLVIGVLVVHAPSARAAVGPKTIVVDGDPGEWTGVVPIANTGAEDLVAGEYVWNDTAGDDTGDGDYTYPKSPDLNRTGLFDLREVRFTADANNLYVLAKFQNLSNTWGGSDGFSTVAAALLIDTTRDASGATAARPNVNVAAGSGWEYWAKIGQSGWHNENAKIFDGVGDWAPIANRANPGMNAIEASIPLAFFAKDGTAVNGATWRFMLLVGSFDGGGPNGFRDTMGALWCCDWNFGGGSDTAYDPNAIDIAFAATQVGQEAELGSYTATAPATIASSVDVTFGALGFTPDTTAPAISAIAASSTFNSAQVTWTTNEGANTEIRWGTAPGSYPNTLTKDEFVTGHSMTLTGLTEVTSYYYVVRSTDLANNAAASAEQSFTTPAAPPSNIATWTLGQFSWKDRTGDDVGDGNYAYPMTNLVDWVGRSDISWVNMSSSTTQLYINAKLNANPETQWKQRMGTIAIFIDTDHQFGSGGRSVTLVGSGAELADPHPMNLSVAPNFAFEYLVVATFQNRSEVGDASGVGEMFVYNSTWNAAQRRWSLIYLSTAPGISPEPATGQVFARNGNEVEIWLNRSVIGSGDNWTYLAAGVLFDDAARPFDQGGIRQVREVASDWIGGGSNGPFNPNVYDMAFYPTTADQMRDLSNYSNGQFANLTWGVQVNFGTRWHRLVHAVPVTHNYAVGVATNVAQLNNGQDATITATFTDKGAPVAGGSVSISASPTSAGSLTGSTVKTTDANGVATFTFRAGSVTSDTVVTFTTTAQNGTAPQVTRTATLTVKAPAPPSQPPAGIDPLLLGGVGLVIVVAVVAALALLMRARKKGGAGGGTGGQEAEPPPPP